MKPCPRPGCGELTAGGPCGKHRAVEERGTSAERGYGRRWRKAREAYLAQHPLCVACEAQGIVAAATDVDHVVAVSSGGAMWDASNWQALCHGCHSIKTAREDGGFGRDRNGGEGGSNL